MAEPRKANSSFPPIPAASAFDPEQTIEWAEVGSIRALMAAGGQCVPLAFYNPRGWRHSILCPILHGLPLRFSHAAACGADVASRFGLTFATDKLRFFGGRHWRDRGGRRLPYQHQCEECGVHRSLQRRNVRFRLDRVLSSAATVTNATLLIPCPPRRRLIATSTKSI